MLGILSDSHDRLLLVQRAVALLRGAGATHLVHCGDIGSPAILDTLAELPAAFVFGNTDILIQPLRQRAQELNIACLGVAGRLELCGKSFEILHGHDSRHMQRLLAQQNCDYILHGHSHVADDYRQGGIRVINPGALHRTSSPTVALLDPAADTLRFLPVGGE